MRSVLDKIFNYPDYTRLYEDRGKTFTAALGVLPPEKLMMLASSDKFVLYVTGDYVYARSLVRQLNEIQEGWVFLPSLEDVLLLKKGIGNLSERTRNYALSLILKGARGAVACVDALTQMYPDKESFEKNIITLQKDKKTDFISLPKKLSTMGYKRTDSVTVSGEFALRGDILDIFLTQYENPLRISFFDDTVESIKFFGAELTTSQEIDYALIAPLSLTYDESALEKARQSANKQKLDGNGRARINTIMDECADTNWLAPFWKQSYLWEYLSLDCTVIWDEPKVLESILNRIYAEHKERFPRLLKAGEVLPEHFFQLVDYAQLVVPYSNFRQMSFQQLASASGLFKPTEVVKFNSTPLFSYKYNIEQLAIDIRNWLKNQYDIIVFAEDKDTSERIRSHLHINGTSIAIADERSFKPHEGVIVPINIERGFVSHTNKLAVIGTKDIIHKASKPKISRTKNQVFLTPAAGEYVVHEQHGIGLCEGIRTIKGSWGTKDFIVVAYKDEDKLYVPVEASNLLTRYAGGEAKPKLSKIGGAEFARIKEKVKAGIKEMTIDLLKLYAEREKKRGFVYKIDGYLCNEFEASFEFVETDDQLRSIAEIDADLTKDKIMDRLLVGDVGFGKTEVALRTAFKVIANGYQVAFMAPTTILAQQHYETARERMKSFDLTAECLNRFRTPTEQKEIIKKVAEGKVDLLIGTHRLLGKDVKFSKLGLLILDEEQRFGVEHKETLKQMKTNVDVLTLSATPIPRTLHMALTGMRDISIISTPPKQRLPIETFVVEESDEMLRDIITREISRGGQVFFVYNRVEGIELFAERIRNLVPNADVIVAHGQMDSALLEKSVYDFAKGKHNVLICTTIIENGIDIPNANTLIVYDADNLGLSQLYQLRGRVGRGDRQAYAYMIYKENKVVSEVAFKRLTSIMENSELGSGFKIAMTDLEIRGAGNVLGREQHGHMQRVGYDMYVKLLEEAMSEVQGTEYKRKTPDTTVEIDMDAYANEEYIPDAESRMIFYQKMANIDTTEETAVLEKELRDIYGPPPQEVKNLLTIVSIKVLSYKAGIGNVVMSKGKAKLVFFTKEDMMREEVFAALSEFEGKTEISSKEPVIELTCGNETNTHSTAMLIKFLEGITKSH